MEAGLISFQSDHLAPPIRCYRVDLGRGRCGQWPVPTGHLWRQIRTYSGDMSITISTLIDHFLSQSHIFQIYPFHSYI